MIYYNLITMLKTYLYIPQQLNEEVNALAGAEKVSKAELMRNALEEGLAFLKRKRASSAFVLLQITKIGRKYKTRGPKDLSQKMDEYLWERSYGKI